MNKKYLDILSSTLALMEVWLHTNDDSGGLYNGHRIGILSHQGWPVTEVQAPVTIAFLSRTLFGTGTSSGWLNPSLLCNPCTTRIHHRQSKFTKYVCPSERLGNIGTIGFLPREPGIGKFPMSELVMATKVRCFHSYHLLVRFPTLV